MTREIEVLARGPGIPAQFGSTSFTLPDDALETRPGEGEKSMQWKLKLHGSIDYWPDALEEFEVVVAPAGG